jgi:hypothetical protein
MTKNTTKQEQPATFKDTVGEDSITRFDKKKKKRYRNNRQRRDKQAGKTASKQHEHANKK